MSAVYCDFPAGVGPGPCGEGIWFRRFIAVSGPGWDPAPTVGNSVSVVYRGFRAGVGPGPYGGEFGVGGVSGFPGRGGTRPLRLVIRCRWCIGVSGPGWDPAPTVGHSVSAVYRGFRARMGPGPYGGEFGFGGVSRFPGRGGTGPLRWGIRCRRCLAVFGPGWDPAPAVGSFGFGGVSRFPGRGGTRPLRWGIRCRWCIAVSGRGGTRRLRWWGGVM